MGDGMLRCGEHIAIFLLPQRTKRQLSWYIFLACSPWIGSTSPVMSRRVGHSTMVIADDWRGNVCDVGRVFSSGHSCHCHFIAERVVKLENRHLVLGWPRINLVVAHRRSGGGCLLVCVEPAANTRSSQVRVPFEAGGGGLTSTRQCDQTTTTVLPKE